MHFSQLLQLVTLSFVLLLSSSSFAATPMPSDGLQGMHAVAPVVDNPASSAAKKATQPKIDTNIKASAVGRVVWVKGSFMARSINGEDRKLEKASIIYEHDVLITGNNAKAQIVFTDNSLMTFNADTRFVVEDYEFEEKKQGKGKYFMRLIEGGFRTITGLIATSDPDSYQVNTPVATIGVRGTDYAVYVKGGELFIGYYKGSPCVSNAEKRLCLNSRNRFARVPDSNSQPEIVKEQPAVFNEQLEVIPANISPSSDSEFGYLTTEDSAGTSSASTSGDSSSDTGSGTSGNASSGAESSSSTSSSGDTSNTFSVEGTSSTSTSGSDVAITNTEIQVTTPQSPSGGTVSSFCIIN